jgi:hypothetical protein
MYDRNLREQWSSCRRAQAKRSPASIRSLRCSWRLPCGKRPTHSEKQPRSTAVYMLMLTNPTKRILCVIVSALVQCFQMLKNTEEKSTLAEPFFSNEMKGCPKVSGDRTRHDKALPNRIRPNYSSCSLCRRQDRLALGWMIPQLPIFGT